MTQARLRGRTAPSDDRVLRPGGRVVLTISDRLRNAKASGTRDAWGQWRWSEADGRRLMAEAGFVDVSASLIGRP